MIKRQFTESISHHLLLAIILLGGLAQDAGGQFEHRISAGSWIPILPEYENLTVSRDGGETSSAFSEPATDWGARLQYHGFYHFSPTRTMLETRVSIAGADDRTERASFVSGGGQQYAYATTRGTVVSATDLNARFRGDTIFNDQYVGLRDRFDLSEDLAWLGLGGRNWGTVDIGCGLGHKSFRQDFNLGVDVDRATTRIDTREELDSDYLGGEAVATWTRKGFGRTWMLDTSLGYFNLDVDYEATTQINGADFDSLRLSEDFGAVTAMIGLQSEMRLGGLLLRPGYQLEYFSNIGQIERNVGGPAILETDEAWVLSSKWEIWF